MGIQDINCYSNFSTPDVKEFEEQLTHWCEKVGRFGKSILIFDSIDLHVGGSHESYTAESGEYFKVTLPEITFTYTRVAGGAMCIMYRVWNNWSQKVMYYMPAKWNDAELWLGE